MKPAEPQNIRGVQLIAELKGCPALLIDNAQALTSLLQEAMQACGFKEVKTFSHKYQPVGVTVVSIIQESHISLHTFPEAAHVSLDIFHCSDNFTALYRLLNFLKTKLCAHSVKSLEILRVKNLETNEADSIINTGQEVEIKYSIENSLYRGRSPWHKIDIIRHSTFGKMLFLNNNLQLTEKDAHLYNQALTAPLAGLPLAEVLILGGGDGGVLKEILAFQPGRVTLVEIDAEVIRLAREFFPEICGQAFTQPNVNLLIQDAADYLAEHRPCDAIICDLTADAGGSGLEEQEVFLSKLLADCAASLKPGGLLSMQCCAESDQTGYRLIQSSLARCYKGFRFTPVFIPSYYENWIFAFAWLDNRQP